MSDVETEWKEGTEGARSLEASLQASLPRPFFSQAKLMPSHDFSVNYTQTKFLNNSCEPSTWHAPTSTSSVSRDSPDGGSAAMARHSNPVEDFSVNVFSITPCQPSGSELLVSDNDKAGATLVFSGVFLGLVGIAFIVMGWAKYEGITHLEWTQLLGPILLSVGVTFLLIAVCKFKMLACTACNQSGERAPEVGQFASRQSFVFTGISQPITFNGATVVQYIPSYPIQEVVGPNSAHVHQLLSHHARLPPFPEPVIPGSSPPHYCNVYQLDNLAFAVDENLSACLAVDTRSERSTDCLEETLKEDACHGFSPPPYEKLFPLSS